MIAPNPINIIVIGTGLIGPRHAQHVKASADAKLFGIVDIRPENRQVADNLDTEFFQTISEMVEFCDRKNIAYPDGAIVCTPNHTHTKVAKSLAELGIHLLVEKPFGVDLGECRALRDYVEEKKVKLLVGHHRRFNPYIVEARKNLEKVGNIVAVQGTWILRKHDEYFKSCPWRTDKSTGGGASLINLVHDIDILQYLIGPIEKVYAEPVGKQRSEYPSVDEGAAVTLKFKNGTVGTFICSDNSTSPFNFENGTGENPMIPFVEDLEGFYRIFGTTGTLSIPDMNLYHQPQLDRDTKGSWIHGMKKEPLVKDVSSLRDKAPFESQLEHFVNIIRNREEPLCTADEGISTLLCIEAITKSIETSTAQFVREVEDIKPNYERLGLSHKGSETIQI